MKAARRFEHHHSAGRAIDLAPDHSAVTEARTLFPSRVGTPPIAWKGKTPLRVLKSGEHSRKIGSHVVKGAWMGFPIYTLTLEERATCPRSCLHWNSCYGNAMPHAARQVAGPELEAKLAAELRDLQRKHPLGFVVRLHVLGDFYSVLYVRVWRRWLDAFPALRVFGYTAWAPDSEIGREVWTIRQTMPARFAVRHSNAASGFRTKSVKRASDAPSGSLVCPAQSHAKADSICCGTCALCWSTQRVITFLEH